MFLERDLTKSLKEKEKSIEDISKTIQNDQTKILEQQKRIESSFKLSSKFKLQPFPFQMYGITYLVAAYTLGTNLLLADHMGLGKWKVFFYLLSVSFSFIDSLNLTENLNSNSKVKKKIPNHCKP